MRKRERKGYPKKDLVGDGARLTKKTNKKQERIRKRIRKLQKIYRERGGR